MALRKWEDDPIRQNIATQICYRTLEVHKRKYADAHAVTRAFLDTAGFNVWEDVAGTLIVELQGYLYDHQKTVSVEYPADWWEALKERFAPQWLLTTHPVRKTRREWTFAAVFPDIKSNKPSYLMRVSD